MSIVVHPLSYSPCLIFRTLQQERVFWSWIPDKLFCWVHDHHNIYEDYIRFMYHLHHANGDCAQAYHALPKMHLREMGLHGFMSCCLYSLGHFCSIIAVTALGQGVGFSFVQTSMLVSGIWGIFYFGEVQGFERITKWIPSSLITNLGILMLSYEHKGVAHTLRN